MNVSVVGSGYVGTTLSACLADLGHDVVAVDIDEETVERMNDGEVTIYEPGLEPLVSAYAGSRLRATTDHAAVVDTDVTFLAVGTPAREDGSIDPAGLLAAARDVGSALAEKDGYHLVVVKSTVLPDVIDDELIPAIEAASGKTDGEEIGVAVRPLRRLWQCRTAWNVELAWWLAQLPEGAEPEPNPAEVASIHWFTPEEMAAQPALLPSNREFLDLVLAGQISLAKG